MTAAVIIGGTRGLGLEIARSMVQRGEHVTITGVDAERARGVAAELGPDVGALGLDLAEPASVESGLASVETVDHLVIAALEARPVTISDFDAAVATRVITLKLVGYAAVVAALRTRFTPRTSVVLFGGAGAVRPYPGSTMLSAFNSGVSGLARTLAVELAPVRVNVLHPGVVGDSPRWRDVPDIPAIARTPLGRLVTTAEIVDAAWFLLTNSGVNAIDLAVDGGYTTT